VGDECDGEESRLTERYTWVPWVGMGLAALVLVGLFAVTARSFARERKHDTDTSAPEEESTPTSVE